MDGPQACHAAGGVRVVIIDQDRETFRRMHEVPTTVRRVADAGIPGLESDEEVAEALERLHNILAGSRGCITLCPSSSRGRLSRL
jgi:hypothetical protein